MYKCAAFYQILNLKKKKIQNLNIKKVGLKLSQRPQFWDERKTEKGYMEGNFSYREERNLLTKFGHQNYSHSFDLNTRTIM